MGNTEAGVLVMVWRIIPECSRRIQTRGRPHARTDPAGSYVVHYGGKVHYGGAKDEETVIQVWGMGPATATPAEKR
jgi:hypothetical protein